MVVFAFVVAANLRSWLPISFLLDSATRHQSTYIAAGGAAYLSRYYLYLGYMAVGDIWIMYIYVRRMKRGGYSYYTTMICVEFSQRNI